MRGLALTFDTWTGRFKNNHNGQFTVIFLWIIDMQMMFVIDPEAIQTNIKPITSVVW